MTVSPASLPAGEGAEPADLDEAAQPAAAALGTGASQQAGTPTAAGAPVPGEDFVTISLPRATAKRVWAVLDDYAFGNGSTDDLFWLLLGEELGREIPEPLARKTRHVWGLA